MNQIRKLLWFQVARLLYSVLHARDSKLLLFYRACSEYHFAEEVKHGRIVVVSNVSESCFENLTRTLSISANFDSKESESAL